MEFFTRCPACGRRFHVKLEDKRVVHLERTPLNVTARTGSTGYGFAKMPQPVTSQASPVTVDIEEIQYSYKCGQCGHQWTKTKKKEHRE